MKSFTLQHALHNKTIESLVLPLSELLKRQIDKGMIESWLDVDTTTLAAIIVKGIETIFHGNSNNHPEYYESDDVKKKIGDFIQLILNIKTGL